MNFNQAAKLMGEGKAVQSLISYTTYEMTSETLLAEGLPVQNEYLTMLEANGEWREVQVIETAEELQKLTEEQMEQLMNESKKHFEYSQRRNMKYE
jgi:DNA polymerase III gamma/tau subunit